MKEMKLRKLIKVLRGLVLAVLVCNYLALFCVPALVASSPKALLEMVWGDIQLAAGVHAQGEPLTFLSALFVSWLFVWFNQYHAVLTVFLWICGSCTAVILYQAKNVLDTMLKGSPFVEENGQYLRRAAVCCFVVSGAALLRTIWGFFYYRSLSPLLTYNFLFCPLFLMGGLLFLVMSALFSQAAEMREEQDLTI